ncbi:hypothetical protein FRC10_001018 [Ceratobasidium sp. 414]|nr:hypothetical protein FRC10_001018 [Ceratobasidium sp. 414]
MVQPDNRLLTNLIKCEKEHHSALLALLVRSHTSLAALSAYASTAAPPVAQALLGGLEGCIQAFAAADEGLRGYAAAVEGWKEELREVRRVEDEVKAVVKDKDILVGRLIKASKQKIPTSSLQAGPAPIPNASYLAPASPSSSSFSLPSTSQPYGQGGYQYTPTPHATQHINSKLALAQRELHACEAHLAGKEAELAEVRRSALTEGMARRCRAMAEVGLVWRERGEQGMGGLEELGRDAAGAPPPPPHTYNPPHRRSASYSSHSSSLAPSHSASQYQRAQSPFGHQRSQSPFGLPRSTSPFNNGPGTYQTLNGGYQHSHPLPSLPERDSWHGESDRSRERPVTYHQSSDERRPMSMVLDDRRPMSLHADDRRPISSLELRLPDTLELDIPPPHSIDDQHAEFIPLGRPAGSMGHAGTGGGGSGSGSASRWGDDSSDEGDETFRVIENERWTGRRDEGGGAYEEEIDPEILRAVEKMGMVVPPKDKPRAARQPPTPPATVSPTSSPAALPDLKIIEATPQKGENGKKSKAGDKPKRKATKRREKDGNLLTARGAEVGAAPTAPVAEEPRSVPTPTVSAPAPVPVARPAAPATAPVPVPTPVVAPEPAPVAARDAPVTTPPVTAPAPQPSSPRPAQQPAQPMQQPEPVVQPPPEPEAPHDTTVGSATLEKDDVIQTGSAADKVESCQPRGPELDTDDLGSVFAATTDTEAAHPVAVAKPPLPGTAMATTTTVPPPAPVRVPTPVSTKSKATKHRTTASASEPLVRDPARVKSTSKRRTAGGVESAGETSGPERGARNKSTKKKSARSTREASTEERADLAATLRDSDTSSPHVHFSGEGGMYVATAPPLPKQPGTLFLPSSGGGGSTRSDVGPARTNHFDVVPPSPAQSANRGRSASGSTSFFGRVAGLFGRKKTPGEGFGSSGSSTWRTRTDAHISRTHGGGGDSSSDEHTPGNLVAVANVTTPAGRLAAIDNTPGSPKRGHGRRLTKADRGQTLRVGPPLESPTPRRSSSTDREERFEPASPGKKAKARKAQSQSVDGGVSRKGSLKSTISEPTGLASRASGSDAGGKRRGVATANLMALVEDPSPAAGLVLPSSSPACRADSPARSHAPQSLLTVPPARSVLPTTTAAPRPIRATSPLKSAMRNTTPSPMPHVASPTHAASPTTTSPTHTASPTLAVPSPVIAPSPRNSMAESVYETGEEDFEDASDDGGDTAPVPVPVPEPAPVVAPTSHGTALAAFKDTISAPLSDATASVSTTQPARRKSVRINPNPPEMSATPSGTPAIELDEEPQWSRKEQVGGGGWRTRIGRGWEDSSESGGDEEYEKVRRALASSYKHMDAVNGSGNTKGKEKEWARR